MFVAVPSSYPQVSSLRLASKSTDHQESCSESTYIIRHTVGDLYVKSLPQASLAPPQQRTCTLREFASAVREQLRLLD